MSSSHQNTIYMASKKAENRSNMNVLSRNLRVVPQYIMHLEPGMASMHYNANFARILRLNIRDSWTVSVGAVVCAIAVSMHVQLKK